MQNNNETLIVDNRRSNDINQNYSKNQRIKKIFLSIIISGLFLMGIIFANSYLSKSIKIVNLNKNFTNLIFERKFSQYDSFTYLKNSSLCSEQILIHNKSQKICQEITSNLTFLVTNISAINPGDNSSKVIDLYLYLNSLTFRNETHSVEMGGANFTVLNSTIRQTYEDYSDLSSHFETYSYRDNNDTNLTNSIPLVMFSMHLNGTYFNISKPVNLSKPEFTHMIELINEFSVKLSSHLYPPINISKEEYYENFGSSYVKPNFSINASNSNEELLEIVKIVDKNNHITIKFPESSELKAILRSTFNKSSGFLQSTILDSIGKFEGENVPELDPPSTDDYFNDFPRENSNFSKINFFQNTKIGAMKTEAKTWMRMVSYNKDDRNLTFMLINFAVQTLFEKSNVTKYVKNETFLEEQSLMQMKIDKMLKNPTKFNKRQLFDKNSIEELRKNFEVTYPVYQFDFFSWKGRLIIDINIRPYENTIESSVILNIDGIINTKIFSRTDKVQLSQSIDRMIEFLYKAYAAIQQLEGEISEELKNILGSKIVQVLEEVANLIKFPFDIESIYKDVFELLKGEINNEISDFIKSIFNLIKNNELNFGNPLENITQYLVDRSDIDVLDYLGNFNDLINKNEKNMRGDISQLYELSQNSTNLFPDIIDDLTYFQQLINKTFNDVPKKVSLQIQSNFKNVILETTKNITNIMDKRNSDINKLLSNSGFSVGLKENIDNLKNIFSSTFGKIKLWGEQFTENFDNKLNIKQEIFEPIGNSARNLITNLNNQIDELKLFIKNKTTNYEDLNIYDQLSSDFDKIALNYQTWRHQNFSKIFGLSSMLNNTVEYSTNYLHTYFNEYLKVESFMHEYFNELKRNVDLTIYEVLGNVNKYNLNIEQLVNDINNMNPIFKQIIEDYQKISISKIDKSISNIMQLFYNYIDQVKNQSIYKSDKIVSCQEEIDIFYSFLNASQPLFENFNKNVSSYIMNSYESIKSSIINIFKFQDFDNATNIFIKINGFNNSLEFINSTEVLKKIGNVFSTQQDYIINISESVIYKSSFDTLISNYKQIIAGKVIDISNYTLIVTCSVRKIHTPLPLKTFCSIFNLTLNEYNTYAPSVEIVKNCSLDDSVTPQLINYKNTSLFETVPVQKLMISNLTLFYSKNRLEQLLSSINSNIDSIIKYSNNNFNEIDQNLNILLDLERNKVQEMLFDKNIEEIEAIFTNQASDTIKNLLQSYSNIVGDIRNFLPNNRSIPAFVVNRIKNMYNEVISDANNIHVNWLKNEVRTKVRLTLENMILVHENNNNNVLRYLKTISKSMIPFIMMDKINQKISNYETKIAKLYENTRILISEIIQFIDVSLTIDYDQFQENYLNIASDFKTIVDLAEKNQEVSKNLSSIFEFNSYEKIKEIKFITENYYNQINGFSTEYLEGNSLILQEISDINFDQFKYRFDSFIKRNSIKEEIIYQSTIVSFDKVFNSGIENLKTYLSNDTQVKDQIYFYVNAVNRTIYDQIEKYKNDLFNELNEFTISIDDQTNLFLNKFNNSVTTQNLKNFKDFQNNVLMKLSNSYSSMLSQFEDIFFQNLFTMINIIKQDLLIKTQKKLDSMRPFLKTKMNVSNKSVLIYEKLQEYETNYLNTLSSMIDEMMINLPNETESTLQFLIETIRENFEKIQKNIMDKLLKTQQNLQINNNIYLRLEQHRNHSDLLQVNLNPASNFEQNMFTFLRDKMTIYSKIVSKVSLSSFNTSTISNLSLFLDNSFQVYTINNIIEISYSYLENLFSFTQTEVRNLNITTELSLLSELIDFHYSALLTPFKNTFYCDSFLHYLSNQTLDSYKAISDVGFNSLIEVKVFMENLMNSTKLASLHSLIMINMKRKIYMDNVPIILKTKPTILMDRINDNLQQKLIQFNNLINVKLDTLTDHLSNSSEKEMIMKNINNEQKLKIRSLISNDILKGIELFNSSIITPLNGLYNNILTLNITQLNTNFTQLESAIKIVIAQLIDQFPQQNQMYQIIINNINNMDNFVITLYEPSQLFKSKINEKINDFQSFIDYIINQIITCIDPLNIAIDNLIIKFAEIIRDSKIIPTIRNDILVPIEKLRQSILDYCINFMNQVTDKIIQIANNILNKESYSKLNFENLPILKNSQKIDLQELEDIVNEFNDIYRKSVTYIKSLPAIKGMLDTFRAFSNLFNGGVSNVIKILSNDLRSFNISIDWSKIQELENKIKSAILDIENTIKKEFVDVTDLIKETQDVIQSFSFESIESVLLSSFNNCKDRLVNSIIADLVKVDWPVWSWDHGERISYDIWLPVGPVPLDFSFGFDWRVWFNINTGINGLDVYSNFQLGASSSVDASAGVGLPLLQVAGYIRGVLARVQADFTLDYNIYKFNAGIKLAFSGAFGEVVVGVGLRTMIQISKLICWLEKVIRKICDWFFLSWLCNFIFDWIQICKWSTYFDWSGWADFYKTKIFTAYEFNHIALLKTLG